MTITQIEEQIFKVKEENFETLALNIFQYQAKNNGVYKAYLEALCIQVDSISTLDEIPFLPIQFFKTHEVISVSNCRDNIIFESSGTTDQITSKHIVNNINLYKQSFPRSFEQFLGNINSYCFLGLLPSYLERGSSSLVYMVNDLISESNHTHSGFYLHNHEALYQTLLDLENAEQKTILIGVTYALLDFAEKYPFKLKHTKIIETGGMKGRREELLREEVHQILKESFGLDSIYSEYGMTELLSQAYSLKEGVFNTPSWMKILVRDVNDPLQISSTGKGVLNIVDLANLYSCSFIATDDIGEVFQDTSFKVNGRVDQAELRGCSLMIG